MVGLIVVHVRRHAVGYVALTVALGGTSYAATALRPQSVGTAALKRGAVTTAKLHGDAVTSSKLHTDAVTDASVAPGSLLARDFKAGQLPRGPKGDPGLSNAYLRVANLPIQLKTSPTAAATLSHLPAGNYDLNADVQLQSDATNVANVICSFGLHKTAVSFAEATLAVGSSQDQQATVPIVDATTLSGSSNSVTVSCSSNEVSVFAQTAVIQATRVGSLNQDRDPFRG